MGHKELRPDQKLQGWSGAGGCDGEQAEALLGPGQGGAGEERAPEKWARSPGWSRSQGTWRGVSSWYCSAGGPGLVRVPGLPPEVGAAAGQERKRILLREV